MEGTNTTRMKKIENFMGYFLDDIYTVLLESAAESVDEVDHDVNKWECKEKEK